MGREPIYEPNDKHKKPWQRGRKGSLCPPELDREAVKTLLRESVPWEKQRYVCKDGRFYCAKEHAKGRWHGHPVSWREVPEPIRREWLREGRIRRADLRKI